MKKHVKKSQVWHYPSFKEIKRLPKGVEFSKCGVFYRDKQNISWPVCKRCSGLSEWKNKLELPKLINEQSIEPPETHI